MALEYEDIDLGQVSEVTKEEFDLAKLEAEGWVTELVISDGDANSFSVTATLDGEGYDDDTNPILAIKVNGALVEPIRNVDVGENSDTGIIQTSYDYLLEMNFPVGTSIKIYHDPNTVDKCDVWLECYGEGTSTIIDMYKCVKRIRSFNCESTCIRCYSLPKSMDKVYFANCLEITAHVPSNVRYAEISPAFTETNDADGNELWEYVDLEVHLDGLPEELYIYGDTEAQPDLHVKAYVPYHLLDEAKNKFPGYAEFIDALLPVSKVSEVGGGKLYRHTVDFDFTDTNNVNDGLTEEGDEPASFIVSISFTSNKKYLLDGDYENDYDHENIIPGAYIGNETDIGVFNDNIVHHLGNGMSATVWLPSGEPLPATIIERDNAAIVFALNDGRIFQIMLDVELDPPLTCSVTDYVTEL